MTKVDMKYTSLFWKLGFIEESTDRYYKIYDNSYRIDIEAEKQDIDYGLSGFLTPDTNQQENYEPPTHLLDHKDFVVLECLNRLLEKGYARERIQVIGNASNQNLPDLIVFNEKGQPLIVFDCKQWGKPYEDACNEIESNAGLLFSYVETHDNPRFLCLYTSHLDGGLLEYRQLIIPVQDFESIPLIYHAGMFEANIRPYYPVPFISGTEYEQWLQQVKIEASQLEDASDYRFQEGILIRYLGSADHLSIPEFVTNINTGAFWNCTSLVSVTIPDGVKTIGGDAFYKCLSLERVNIPPSVQGIGNNPFAGCPRLIITNESPHFVLEDGILYNRGKTKIIHYTIQLPARSFEIPEGVRYIEKHAFYNCKRLSKLTIPSSVASMENNVVSGIQNIQLINHSPYFQILGGVLYNFEITQLYSVFDHKLEILEIPNSVRTIGKNSFWNLDNLKKVIIPESVTRIGYNPFAGCNNLVIENHSPVYALIDGILFNPEKTELICCPNAIIVETVNIPETVTKLGRNSFSCCTKLQTLELPPKLTEIARGVFNSCANLTSITIPKSVKTIGEWAFSDCPKLKTITLPKSSHIEDNTFAHCQIDIIWE